MQAVSLNVVTMCRETSLASVTALLSSLLLQSACGHHHNHRDTSSHDGHVCAASPTPHSDALPPRFLATAHAALTIVNNVFLLSLEQAQDLVAAADLRTELLYCASSLVAFCTEHWNNGSNVEVRHTPAPFCVHLRTLRIAPRDRNRASCVLLTGDTVS